MAHNWIDIEDDLDIINKKIDESMEEMEEDRKDYQEENEDEEIIAPPEEAVVVLDSTEIDNLNTL